MNEPRPDTHEHVIVLRVLVDGDLPWWEALGLPDPACWSLSDTFALSVFPKVILEEVVRR